MGNDVRVSNTYVSQSDNVLHPALEEHVKLEI
jgi:hypothetical protein